MTTPAASSLCLFVVSLLLAGWILGLTQAPGWRGLRSFVWIAASAAGYGLGTLTFTLPVSDTLVLWGTKTALVSGMLFGCSWIVFSAHLDARPLDLIDRAALGCGLVLCALVPIPHLLFSEQVGTFHSGVGGAELYRFADTTRLGDVALGLEALANIWVGVQLLRRSRRSQQGHGIHALALLALVPLALTDAFVAHGHLDGPSLLSFGMLLSVATVGVQISKRVAADTRDLASVSERLSRAQERLLAKERLAAVGEAAAIVSHEVRNPLGVLFNVFSQLHRTLPSELPERAALEQAREASEDIDRVVAQLVASTQPHPQSTERRS